jgi:hypothetical protein
MLLPAVFAVHKRLLYKLLRAHLCSFVRVEADNKGGAGQERGVSGGAGGGRHAKAAQVEFESII